MRIKVEHFEALGVCGSGLDNAKKYFSGDGLDYAQALEAAFILDSGTGTTFHRDYIHNIANTFFSAGALPERDRAAFVATEYKVTCDGAVYLCTSNELAREKAAELRATYIEHIGASVSVAAEIVNDAGSAVGDAVRYIVFDPLNGAHSVHATLGDASAMRHVIIQSIAAHAGLVVAIHQRVVYPAGDPGWERVE